MSTDQSRYAFAADRAAAKVIDGDAIVIDTITGRYYSLEGTGEAAWALLVSSLSLSDVADALRERYDTGTADVLADVRRLADELVSEHLLVEAPNGAQTAPAPAFEGTRAAYAPPTLTIFRDMEEILAFDPPLPGANTTVWTAEPREP